MIQKSYCLRSLGDIENCIRLFAASYVPGKQSILISIYTHWNKPETIREMIRLFCDAFPEAEIAGMTTAGGIENGRMRLHQTIVTIQFFEKSDVHTAIYDFSKEPMETLGERALADCQKEADLSAVLLFMTQQYYDFEPFLSALDRLPKNISICGGYAHTYRNEEGIYVFTKTAILSRGILLITFSGGVKVMTQSVMGWQPLGRTMTITAMDGPLVIRSLDHEPAAYFYQKYLHSTDFGKSELLFPPVRTADHVQLSILPLEARSDGALQTNVISHVGDQVQMAYGDPDQVILSSREALGHIERFAPEGMLLISCVTRRYFLKKAGLIEHKDHFKIYVYDTGIGIPKSKLKKLLIDHKRRDHIGLINVHQRLLSLFGEKSGLHIVSRENKGTLVFTNIPKIESRKPAAPAAIEKVAATGQTIRITNA